MKTLREAVQDASARKVAIGHFNVSDSNQVRGIVDAARELNVPVIIGVSEGERKWIGVRQVAALVHSYREQGMDVYLNADHTKSLEGVKEAIDAGFDAVLYDGSSLPFDENAAHAREAVALARESGRDVMVESELGYIGTSSAMLDAIPDGAGLQPTDPEEAARFVQATGIDLLAPSVGNIHGMLKSMPNPKLDIQRIEAIYAAAHVPVVLHGGSGTSDADFRAAVAAGAAIVHINTEIRLAYRRGIEEGLAKDVNEVSPYKFLEPGYTSLKKVVKERLALFANVSL